MYSLVFLLSVFGTCLAAIPLKETPHYKIYALSDFETRRPRDFSNGNSKAIIENPLNETVPSDNGGNFGDWVFPKTLKNGTLIERDTIINERYDQNIVLYYYRYFPGQYLEDYKLLNFGRERGWVDYAAIYPTGGRLEAEIYIAAGNQIRILAEFYARA